MFYRIAETGLRPSEAVDWAAAAPCSDETLDTVSARSLR